MHFWEALIRQSGPKDRVQDRTVPPDGGGRPKGNSCVAVILRAGMASDWGALLAEDHTRQTRLTVVRHPPHKHGCGEEVHHEERFVVTSPNLREREEAKHE